MLQCFFPKTGKIGIASSPEGVNFLQNLISKYSGIEQLDQSSLLILLNQFIKFIKLISSKQTNGFFSCKLHAPYSSRRELAVKVSIHFSFCQRGLFRSVVDMVTGSGN